MRVWVVATIAALGGTGVFAIGACGRFGFGEITTRGDAAETVDDAPDAMVDAFIDPMVDAMPDAMVDAMPDAMVDAMVDAMIDAPFVCAAMPCTGTATFINCLGKCFSACTDLLTQAAAATACTQWGGTLASIASQDQEDCVQTIQQASAWIGYQQGVAAIPVVGWFWHDAAPPTYTYWSSGEPNDADGVEDGAEQCALSLAAGAWLDGTCTTLIGTVCSH